MAVKGREISLESRVVDAAGVERWMNGRRVVDEQYVCTSSPAVLQSFIVVCRMSLPVGCPPTLRAGLGDPPFPLNFTAGGCPKQNFDRELLPTSRKQTEGGGTFLPNHSSAIPPLTPPSALHRNARWNGPQMPI